MSNIIHFEDLGLRDYKEVWDYQENLFNQLMATKTEIAKTQNSDQLQHLLFVEHPHVYTLGKSGEVNNLLINDQFLKNINATFYKINRGGDITYHGPGQIVGYPIFDLEKLKMGVKEYIFKLEQAIIDTLAHYNLNTDRLDGATGVWLDTKKPGSARKLCAIGVRASRYITMHGFALNVNTNLTYFSHINPCGFVDKGVTSMQKELGYELDFDEVKEKLEKIILKTFNLTLA